MKQLAVDNSSQVRFIIYTVHQDIHMHIKMLVVRDKEAAHVTE